MPVSASPSFVILGGGPAGLAAAYKLSQRGCKDVTVLERGASVGGNAGSFVIDGIPVDFGSHRLHPVCPPAVMADIRALLGDDLLDRPRHGRIRLRGRWVHFPLKPLDLLLRLPPAFAAGVLVDIAAQALWPGVRRAKFCVDSRARTRPDDLPRLLLSVRAQDLGTGAGRARCRTGQAPRLERIDRQDGEARDGRASGHEAARRRPVLLSATRLRADQRRAAPGGGRRGGHRAPGDERDRRRARQRTGAWR